MTVSSAAVCGKVSSIRTRFSSVVSLSVWFAVWAAPHPARRPAMRSAALTHCTFLFQFLFVFPVVKILTSLPVVNVKGVLILNPQLTYILSQFTISVKSYPVFVRLITFSLVNSSRSFSSSALPMVVTRLWYVGMVMFFKAFARFWVLRMLDASR